MNDDAALLRSYAEEGSEAAFTALVQRHLDLVYAAALRRVDGNPHLAADIAQQVFTNVARQAGRLAHVNVLGAWLHTATRNAATDLMISEHRRKVREQASLDPALAPDNSMPEWERLKPVLDAAIDELAAPDREVIVLRFLERRPFGEIGTALKVSSDAARMRTERALDKLRAALERRGITSTAAAVGAIMGSQPLVSAPAGLASSIASGACAMGGASAGVLTLTFASLMKLKTIVTGIAILFAFGAGAYVGLMQQFDAPPLPAPEMPRHSQTIADLRKENLSLRIEAEQLKTANIQLATPRPAPIAPAPRAVAATTAAPEPETRSVAERQKGMMNNLRQLNAARSQFAKEHGRAPFSVHELIGYDKYVRPFAAVDGEDYSGVALGLDQPMTVTAPSGVSVTFDPAGTHTTASPARPPSPPLPPHIVELQQRIKDPAKAALQAYQAAHSGARPPETKSGARALLPYFATPQAGADFVEYIEALPLPE